MFVQRQFQKYQKRSADEQQISLVLKDFEDADLLLGKVSNLELRPAGKTLTGPFSDN